ncbi:hypothetical protein PHLCEN_2v5548 [Hermanssonia centrifuga]|uniref:Uncharacterized protein n=1 Tax=Hermanssonia centrifuga TaxID=98765 RepID=A0A2R6P222_9APHY|nr:hypothetical protein PHLCEN_2v5548 [Hermanssonia centrifuga]
MTATYAALHRHMSEEQPYVSVRGRKSKYNLPNMFDGGLSALMTESSGRDDTAATEESVETEPSLDDLTVELDI